MHHRALNRFLSAILQVYCYVGFLAGLKKLVESGYRVSTGVWNVLDTDYEVAQLLKVPIVSEAQFSPITDESYEEGLRLASNADVSLVTSTLFGYSNLRNLEMALRILEKGVRVLVMNDVPIERGLHERRGY